MCAFTPSTWETDSRSISVSTRPPGLCSKFQTQAGGGCERKERRNEGRKEKERGKKHLLNMDVQCSLVLNMKHFSDGGPVSL